MRGRWLLLRVAIVAATLEGKDKQQKKQSLSRWERAARQPAGWRPG